VAAATVAALALAGAGVAADATLFSPVAFVRVYLDALARGDAVGAAGVPGVGDRIPAELLVPEALAPLEVTGLRELGAEDGIHRVEVVWTGPDGPVETVLEVERSGTSGLLFPRWAFAEPPVAELALALAGDERLRLNDAELRLPEPRSTAVLVPGVYRVAHESRYLTSEPVVIVAGAPGTAHRAEVEAAPNARLTAEVREAARRFLDDCARQQLLYPTGCPFGKRIRDRVTSAPSWSIAAYPEPVLELRGGRWRAGPAEGVAHLSVGIRDVFDGRRHTLEEDVGFRLSLEVGIGPDDVLRIVPDDALSLR